MLITVALGVQRTPGQHAGERAAGNAAQRWPQDRGHRPEVALTSEARAETAVRVHASIGSCRPHAVKRVHIPKASNPAKLRPLGIPVVMDRCHQARVRNALEPEWEARFEPRSYGFRPGRGCQDAIQSIFQATSQKLAKRMWVLDADLAAAFDRIDHARLLESIGTFPARDMIRDWLGRSRVWVTSADDALAKITSRDACDRSPAERSRVQRAASGMRTVMYGCSCSSHSLVSLAPVVWSMTASMAARQS